MTTLLQQAAPRRRRHYRARPTGIRRRTFAQECFPESTTPEVAVARLNRWIDTDITLLRTLERKNYYKRSRTFSPEIEATLREFLM